MADIDSNLPIFSRSTSDPVIVSADTSANAASNPIFTQLTDGSTNIGVTGNALDVNVASGSVTVTATDLDIRDLDHTQDSVELGDGTNLLDFVVVNSAYGATPTSMPIAGKYESTPTTYDDGDATPLLVDANGRLQVDVISGGGSNDSVIVDDSAFTIGTDSVTAIGCLADETSPDSVDEGDVGLARMTLDRKQLMVLTDATTDANRLAIDGSGHAQVDLAAVSATAVPVSADGNANTESNPIFVQVVSGALSGIEVIDYDTSASVATDATDNHDYTVTGTKTLKVQRCYGSASGAQKIEISSGPLASLASKAVLFTSMANPNWSIDFGGLLEVPDTSTGTLRIARTNRDEAAMDVYSTVIGTEV